VLRVPGAALAPADTQEDLMPIKSIGGLAAGLIALALACAVSSAPAGAQTHASTAASHAQV
jgi:hypothetical protein